ncbi:MAG: class I SAM-dependent methyltransferase [Candidatus Pacebacteria bacterium]|nr:class I SAM-dependent methyltransferase [Candidatus Paceibacterota bacterium]
MKNPQNKDTSWNKVADWYDDLLKNDDSYQAKVILPNLLRFLDLKKGEQVFDLACGQGYFANIFAHAGANVIASDISKKLIETAKKDSKPARNASHSDAGGGKVLFYISPAHRAQFLKDNSINTVVVVLAIQNIENVGDVFAECKRVLKNNGRMVLVLNHPAFRVPQGSDWYFEEGIQSRIVHKYLSESKLSIDMTPGEKDKRKKISTISFHRSLQYYMKLLSKNGFAITRLEEWISHKQSGVGPRQLAEDKARKEIPMFMCIEVKKI